MRFVRPEEGIPFMSYAWGGMIGVLSGSEVLRLLSMRESRLFR
ncbi:hypothetical protein HMPREF1320_1995 [Capnocytophaga sp. oral taxon 335 str. F0486]|nr:hypothetical protein HMPREF1320_1995 [Capnocytophaga sp. oral taxon 335 str. F0486]